MTKDEHHHPCMECLKKVPCDEECTSGPLDPSVCDACVKKTLSPSIIKRAWEEEIQSLNEQLKELEEKLDDLLGRVDDIEEEME